ncbi:MAG: isochorismatase family cysteine hydrolase [Candidatus Nanohaloarchaea archaeon]|nr:isochorismatase family cysteine hydrolase [Candidatus Nanohaloarchaea archaeon]
MIRDGNTALILVDFQKEWFLEDSEFYLGDMDIKVDKVTTLVHEALKEGHNVIYTKRYIDRHPYEAFPPYQPSSDTFESRSDIHEEIPVDRGTVVEHYGWDPFYQTDLENILVNNQVSHLVIAGLAINAGVRSCIESAFDRGFDITVVKDCCAGEKDEDVKFTLEDLQKYREFEVKMLHDFEEFIYSM